MSVESYLDSIRKNTIKNSEKTSNLNNTMKDLLNYESLKKAVSAGVESGNKEQFKRLAELSKKILTNSDATTAELKETNQLLKLFYAQIPKNSSGSTAVSADSWVKALKEVLDEFGNSLPEKFQKRLKYDIVSSAAEAGANPKLVMQQLNMTQVNQTMVVQNIFDYMKDKDKKLERDAEARKPVENNEKKEQSNFWQTRLGKVIDYLGGILKSLTGVAKWAGILAVGMAVWSQLKDSLREALQGIASLRLVFNAGKFTMSLNKAFKGLNIGKSIGEALGKTKLGGMIGGAAKSLKTAGTNFLWDTKIGNGILELITNPKLAKFTKNVGTFFKGASKIIKPLFEVAKPLFKVLGKLSGWITIISSIYDFINGFVNTKGTLMDKIFGGLKNVIFQIVDSIWFLVKFIGKAITSVVKKAVKFFISLAPKIPGMLISAWIRWQFFMLKMIIRVRGLITNAIRSVIIGIANAFKAGWNYVTSKGLKGILKDAQIAIKNICGTLGKMVKTFVTFTLSSVVDAIGDGIASLLEEKDLNIVQRKFLQFLQGWFPKSNKSADNINLNASQGTNFKLSDMINLDFKMPEIGLEAKSGSYGGIYEPATNTVYTGRDALSAAMPLESHVAGRTPANASGINKGYGVKLSSQTADFIKRAGITERITSGMEGAHKGTKYSPRTHASGNKFDMDISTSSVTRFANTVEKLLRTPGIKEIRTERVPNWVVEGGRRMLERKGYRTKGILFNDGYPNYATGPHLDVLIDPRYSGVKGSAQNLASTQGAMENAGDIGIQTQKASNPLVASMQAQIAKAYNEAVKSFGVKSPNQLVANQSKANTSAITAQLANKASGDAVTFSKKNDISDTNLALLRLVDMV